MGTLNGVGLVRVTMGRASELTLSGTYRACADGDTYTGIVELNHCQ